MLFNNKTALLTKVKNAQDMADKICYLIENEQKRIELAQEGHDYVQHFTWEVAIDKMDNLIKQLLAK
ncbi:MAG: glycosyltransferase [Dysgonomonas sp.]